MKRYPAFFAVLAVLLCLSRAEARPADISCHFDIPYKLTAVAGEGAGASVKALVAVENSGPADRVVHVSVSFPAGFAPQVIPEGWQADAGRIAGDVRLPGGYGQWFELLSFDAGTLPGGEYAVAVTVADGTDSMTLNRTVPIGRKNRETDNGKLVIERVVLPVDRLGNYDDRLNANTLVLRDKTLDYYKNVFKGKGAYNDVAEAVHPLAYMNVAFVNPAGEERLLLITSRLFDLEGRAVAGMFTPAASIDDREVGGFADSKDGTEAFVALSGEARQTVRLPVYVDENQLSGGRYIMGVSVREGGREVARTELPVTVIARDSKAAAVTLAAVALVACGLAFSVRCRRSALSGLKTRWLITITLFGAVSFAAVNVPTTLLNDGLHALLGPLAFLVTGMFHGVILYMLLAALVVLVPRPGVVTLLLTVRLLLGLLAFGHASPVALLLYGSQAVLLEAALYITGITAARGEGGEDRPPAARNRRRCLLFALVCGLADGLSTYLNIHSLAFLYRLFYAEWYIAAAVAVNGFLYSGIGGYCGVVLGDKLRTVGSD